MEDESIPQVLPPEESSPQSEKTEENPAQILEYISSDLVPRFLSLKTWPENVKKEFLEQFYKSMVCI